MGNTALDRQHKNIIQSFTPEVDFNKVIKIVDDMVVLHNNENKHCEKQFDDVDDVIKDDWVWVEEPEISSFDDYCDNIC